MKYKTQRMINKALIVFRASIIIALVLTFSGAKDVSNIIAFGTSYSLRNAGLDSVVDGMVNYPNPFDSRTGSTTIYYKLKVTAGVEITIYDLFGNIVRTYDSSYNGPGAETISWDGTNDSGKKVAKGGYICLLSVQTPEKTYLATRKIGVIH